MHEACSVEALKAAARPITSLKEKADRMLPDQSTAMMVEYELGMKGLLKAPVVKPEPKVEKPLLNTQDLDDMYYL